MSDDQTKTLEQEAKVRQRNYLIAAIATAAGPALGAALVQGGVAAWLAFVVAVLGPLTGSGGLVFAAHKTSQQRKDGTFTPAPEPAAVLSPLEQVQSGLPALVQNVAQATGELDQAKNLVVDVLGVATQEGARLVSESIKRVVSGR